MHAERRINPESDSFEHRNLHFNNESLGADQLKFDLVTKRISQNTDFSDEEKAFAILSCNYIRGATPQLNLESFYQTGCNCLDIIINASLIGIQQQLTEIDWHRIQSLIYWISRIENSTADFDYNDQHSLILFLIEKSMTDIITKYLINGNSYQVDREIGKISAANKAKSLLNKELQIFFQNR